MCNPLAAAGGSGVAENLIHLLTVAQLAFLVLFQRQLTKKPNKIADGGVKNLIHLLTVAQLGRIPILG